MNGPIPVVAQLAEIRRELGLSQREVAERMGARQSQLSELERGITGDPRWTTLERYATAVECELDVTIIRKVAER